MSNGLTLRIVPQGKLAETLNAAAHATLPKDDGRTSNRRRKKRIEVRSPVTNSVLEVSWSEVEKSEWSQSCAFTITARMADHLLSPNCLTENFLLPAIAPAMAFFKYAIAEQFPNLRADLEQLTVQDCKVTHLQAEYPFLFESEEEAIGTFHETFVHTKAVLDGREHSFAKSKKPITSKPPRVHTSDAHRWSFTIDLPFGTATVKLTRSWDDCPKTVARLKESADRNALRTLLRKVLVVVVEVDLEKFSFDGRTLPQNPESWTKDKLQQDPFQLIWNAVRFDLWLNWPLIVDESQVDWETLNEEERGVLHAYFDPAGGDLRQLPALQRAEAPHKFHSLLINKAFANIEIPWTLLRNNRSQCLGPKLEYENRLKPSEHPILKVHTLSASGAKVATQALLKKLNGESDPESEVA